MAIPYDELVRSKKRKGMGESQAVMESLSETGQLEQGGLAAIAAKKKKEAEAQKASELPPMPEKKVEPVAPVAGKPVANPRGVEQMPKEEVDALRLAEQKKFEERRRKAEEAKKGKK
jgi:hypothetical protein